MTKGMRPDGLSGSAARLSADKRQADGGDFKI
jgi:hypothetical protein